MNCMNRTLTEGFVVSDPTPCHPLSALSWKLPRVVLDQSLGLNKKPKKCRTTPQRADRLEMTTRLFFLISQETQLWRSPFFLLNTSKQFPELSEELPPRLI